MGIAPAAFGLQGIEEAVIAGNRDGRIVAREDEDLFAGGQAILDESFGRSNADTIVVTQNVGDSVGGVIDGIRGDNAVELDEVHAGFSDFGDGALEGIVNREHDDSVEGIFVGEQVIDLVRFVGSGFAGGQFDFVFAFFIEGIHLFLSVLLNGTRPAVVGGLDQDFNRLFSSTAARCEGAKAKNGHRAQTN